MYVKATLFFVAGVLCVAGILVESPTLRTAVLLAIGVWSFCRLYYFFFYVLEKYIDPAYRFEGMVPALRYLLQQRKPGVENAESHRTPPLKK